MPGRSQRKSRLEPESVRRWLEAQQAAQEVIEAERYRRLRELDETTALRIYLELSRLPTSGRAPEEPSPLLMAMRQAVARLQARGSPALDEFQQAVPERDPRGRFEATWREVRRRH